MKVYYYYKENHNSGFESESDEDENHFCQFYLDICRVGAPMAAWLGRREAYYYNTWILRGLNPCWFRGLADWRRAKASWFVFSISSLLKRFSGDLQDLKDPVNELLLPGLSYWMRLILFFIIDERKDPFEASLLLILFWFFWFLIELDLLPLVI